MSDRRLLELAAKAAGIFLTPESIAKVFPGFEWVETDEPLFRDGGLSGTVAWHDEGGNPGGTARVLWRPLHDDGDALRLAVKLEIDIFRNSCSVGVTYRIPVHGTPGEYDTVIEPVEVDPYAATRRAIVRAAAAIGEQTP